MAQLINEVYNFVPSPIAFDYDESFLALANDSGRMQYYHTRKGGNRIRIGRNKFIAAYNTKSVIAVRPLPSKAHLFQLHFFTKQ